LMSYVRSGDLTTIPRKDTQACKSLMYMLSFQSSPLEDRVGKLLSYMFLTCVDDSRVAVVHTDEDPESLAKWITLIRGAFSSHKSELPHIRKDLVFARHSATSPCVDCYELIP
ncbi:MAG: hypothetical protein ACXACA_00450, partial [Candidatus Ranarchaeia archaeon]|jgi:hypothetical protein